MEAVTFIYVPSGQPIYLYQVVENAPGQDGSWFFRFIAPNLGADVDYAALEPDFETLCREVALDQIPEGISRVVISLADRETEFGVATPDAVQVFEAYTINDGTCEWEAF